MSKMSKKRRQDDISLSISSASMSLPVASTEDSIDSLLAEMAGDVSSSNALNPSSEELLSTSGVASVVNENIELCDPTLVRVVPTSSSLREKISTWNRAMIGWQKSSSGTYTTGLLPSFDVELARHFKVQALSTYLLDACKEIKIPSFERWLIDSKLEERQYQVPYSDPVLSGSVTAGFESSKRLTEEIRESGGATRDAAKKLVQDLCRRTATAVGEIAQQHALHSQRAPLRKGDRIEREGHPPVYTLVYHRKSWKKPFCIKLNSTHYDKLRAMFQRIHGNDSNLRWTEVATGKATRLTHSFHLLLMVMLLRYSSLSGGQLLLDLRGGGMQGAIHGEVFQVLHQLFPDDRLLECFGSPLNAYLPAFGSAFSVDLDWHFGSIGNFLDVTIADGCCEANPPFSPGMMTAMAERIEYNIEQANLRKDALSFVVIVPSAGDEKDSQRAAAKRFGGVPLQAMLNSANCRIHILLSAKDHGYVEGAQHMRSTRYKESLYDTSVLVLQSKVARRRPLDVSVLEVRIREAFASRHREEVERRKKSDDVNEEEPNEAEPLETTGSR